MAEAVAEETPPTFPSPLKAFESRHYEHEVLSLEEGQTEQDLDEEYIQDAQDAGIEMLTAPSPAKDSASSWLSMNTISTAPPRRSNSSDSRRSSSTGLTSNFSKASTDPYYTTHPYHLRFRSLSRPSIFDHNTSESSIPNTPNDSKLSLAIPATASATYAPAMFTPPMLHESPRKPFSVRRGFGRLSKLRKSTNAVEPRELSCSRCAHTELPQVGPFFTFYCGHSACRPHLRQMVTESLRAGQSRPPQCCSRSIPRIAVQAVTRDEEEARLFPPPPRPPPPRISSIPRLPADFSRQRTERGGTDGWGSRKEHSRKLIPEEAQRNLRCAMACSNFKALRKMQEDQCGRFLKFRRIQRDELATYHTDLRKSKEEDRIKEFRELQESHQQALTKLEDKHVTAEIDLEAAQAQEKRNCLLKLRHMEAYVHGTSTTNTPNASSMDLHALASSPITGSALSLPLAPSNPISLSNPAAVSMTSPHVNPTLLPSSCSAISLRTVTDQDRNYLSRQYWERDHISSRHTSAINVLREQQARQVRLLASKQESEVSLLERRHADEMATLDRTAIAEVAELDSLFARRKERLVSRWELAAEIWKRRKVEEGILTLPFPIAAVGWPEEATAEDRDAVTPTPVRGTRETVAVQ